VREQSLQAPDQQPVLENPWLKGTVVIAFSFSQNKKA
jgi:hypothetical protein